MAAPGCSRSTICSFSRRSSRTRCATHGRGADHAPRPGVLRSRDAHRARDDARAACAGRAAAPQCGWAERPRSYRAVAPSTTRSTSRAIPSPPHAREKIDLHDSSCATGRRAQPIEGGEGRIFAQHRRRREHDVGRLHARRGSWARTRAKLSFVVAEQLGDRHCSSESDSTQAAREGRTWIRTVLPERAGHSLS